MQGNSPPSSPLQNDHVMQPVEVDHPVVAAEPKSWKETISVTLLYAGLGYLVGNHNFSIINYQINLIDNIIKVYRWVIAPLLPSAPRAPISSRKKAATTTAATFGKSLKKLLDQIDSQAERIKIQEVRFN